MHIAEKGLQTFSLFVCSIVIVSIGLQLFSFFLFHNECLFWGEGVIIKPKK